MHNKNTTASGAADDSLLLCASDLQHSAIYDNPHEMVDCVRAVADRITTLAASAPVAPTQREEEMSMLIRRIVSSARRNCEDNSNVLKLANEAWSYLARNGLTGSALRDEGIASAAPVAPAPQPAPMPYQTDAQIDAVYEQTMGQHLRSQDAPAVRRFGRAMFLCAWNAAAPKADQIEDGLAMVPAPLQQGEYLPLPECDATTVGLGAVWNRHSMRAYVDADRAARGAAQAAQAAPAPVAEDAANWHWLASYLVGPRTDLDDEIVASESVNDLRKLVSAARARAQAAQAEGGANANR